MAAGAQAGVRLRLLPLIGNAFAPPLPDKGRRGLHYCGAATAPISQSWNSLTGFSSSARGRHTNQ